MALLKTEGFDWQAAAGNLALVPGVTYAVGSTSGSITFIAGNYGVGRAAWLRTGSTASDLPCNAQVTFAIAATSTVYVQADIYVTRLGDTLNRMAGTIKNLALYDGATLQTDVTINSLGQLAVYRGTTLIDTSAAVISVNRWYRLDVRAVIADSGGTIDIYVDGVSAVSFSGDTRNAGTGTINSVMFGVQNRSASGVGIGTEYVLDNVVIQDSTGSAPYNAPLPAVIVDGTLRPTADVSVQGAPSTGSSNFALVDETYLDTADYVSFDASEIDRYDVANLSENPLNIYAVKALALVGSGSSGLQGRTKMIVASDTLTGTSATVTSANSIEQVSTVRPAGGAWTKSDVDALRVEFERTT